MFLVYYTMGGMEKLYHLIDTEQLSQALIKRIFSRADYYNDYLYSKVHKRISIPQLKDLEGVRVYVVFFEESTRTYSTFISAAKELGALVIGIPLASQFSSFAKQESLEHSIEFWSGVGISYLRCADIIIIRHFDADATERAARVSKVPIINAGCGGEKGQHPTQVLLDLYSFQKFLGRLNNFNIAFVGDLRFSRIIPSEVTLLSRYPNIKFYFIAPEGFKLPEEVKTLLKAKSIPFEEINDIKEVVSDCHLVYVTRVQKNRLERLENKKEAKKLLREYQKNKNNFQISKEVYDRSHKMGTIFCHPGPIDSKEQEIRPEVEKLPRVKFLKQWSYGLPIRMAVLKEVWESQKEIDLKTP